MKKDIADDKFLNRKGTLKIKGKPVKNVIGNTGIVRAVHKFRDALSVRRYQTNQAVLDILETQAGRIQNILEEVDDQVAKLDFKATKNSNGKQFQKDYERQDLGKEWGDWVKERANRSDKKILDWLKTYDALLQQRLTELGTWKTGKMTKEQKKEFNFVIELIKDAGDAYVAVKALTWNNPL